MSANYYTDRCLHLRNKVNYKRICDATLWMPNDDVNATRLSSMEKGQTLTNSQCFSFIEKSLNPKICPTHSM